MHFVCRSFIGKSASNSWYQFWENEPDDPTLIDSRGHLFGLIGVSSLQDSVDPKNLGHEFIDSLNQNYFSGSFKDTQQSLQEAVSHTIKLFPQISVECLTVLVIHHHLIHLYCHTGSSVNLLRGGRISRLLTSSSDTHYLTGSINHLDRFFIVTDNLVDQIGWPTIKQSISPVDLSVVEELFSSTISSLKDQQKSSLSLIDVHLDDEYITPAQAPPSPIHNSKPQVFVTKQQPVSPNSRQRINLIIGFFLLVGLSISIMLGFQKKQAEQKEKTYQQFSVQLTKTISDGQAIKNLNLDTAKELGQQANSLLTKIKNLKTSQHQSQIDDFQKQIDQLLSQTGSADPAELPSWYDTSLIVNQPHFNHLRLFGDQLFLLDTQNGRLDTLSVKEKSTQNIAISDQLKKINQLAVHNNQAYGLVDSSIISIAKNDIKSIADLTKLKPSGTIVSLEFWNDSLYLLDQTNHTIWRLTPVGSQYDSAAIWLKNNLQLLADPSSLAINGKVWVLSSNGVITPYLRGQADKFTPSQTPTFTQTRNLVVGQDKEVLAFVDGDNTVYVYQKSGQTSGKYSFGPKIINIAYYEPDNTIFVLCDDQKIYKVTL